MNGRLIINADDWGRDRETTDRTLECVVQRTLSSVSAMIFMEDSERAAAIAREHRIDAGLHLNLTTALSAKGVPERLIAHQENLARHLRHGRLAQIVFHPGLANSFQYVVASQRDEFIRLYGCEPQRVDGHHHMHLCLNIIMGKLLPAGIIVRRNFSFQRGEKSVMNRLYRRTIDGMLARRHQLTDYFFSLPPLDPPGRVQTIFSLADKFSVEVETHPINPQEHRFLTDGQIFDWLGSTPIAPSYSLS